jgi:hypothetical protein
MDNNHDIVESLDLTLAILSYLSLIVYTSIFVYILIKLKF